MLPKGGTFSNYDFGEGINFPTGIGLAIAISPDETSTAGVATAGDVMSLQVSFA